MYFEDYLETIDGLPSDFQHNVQRIRDIDAKCQTSNEAVKRRELAFYQTGRLGTTRKELLDEQVVALKQEYAQLAGLAQEKLTIANDTYDMVDRHIRRLDAELKKFADDLEADYPGITPELEKRSLLLDSNSTSTMLNMMVNDGNAASSSTMLAIPNSVVASRAASPGAVMFAVPGLPAMAMASSPTPDSIARKARKSNAERKAEQQAAMSVVPQFDLLDELGAALGTMTDATSAPIAVEVAAEVSDERFCHCRQISHGQMIACDDPYCRIEWFHYGCVGLTETPKGKWYCSDCLANRKRRKSQRAE
ncbi:hypothetical protein CAOG_02166 [Capsaspora owczarzaki ATCC 30864]|uniref:Uncharacterized protein n=1 Tax=Capsaspora owczarzaki (strain ATCC 30864) TaxID=595528 RepID=A0A0D2U706_CAPO3|nr:hypothetical protein CAOG_02166 [Capsaspora owczarzaki ATCC 30864]KJE90941.1 hypothetical protein CAOG_002166 [Capsaspora owczarzaki ATCC 30864]|eukprot:XP_004348916.1 hypothetical protein CAOG_02166 [Capsaspora owczarzaki ATCC 30864]